MNGIARGLAKAGGNGDSGWPLSEAPIGDSFPGAARDTETVNGREMMALPFNSALEKMVETGHRNIRSD